MKTQILDLLLSMLLMHACCVMGPALAQVQVPSPPPAKDYSPDKWDEYTSEQGRFRIRFPGKPQEESSIGARFLSYSGLLDYRVSYVDEPEITDDPNSGTQYLQKMKSASKEILRYSNERIIQEKDVTIDRYPGYFIHVESAKGWVRIQQIVVGKRVYTIVVEGRKGRANEIEGKDDFEKAAMGFINSFKPIS